MDLPVLAGFPSASSTLGVDDTTIYTLCHRLLAIYNVLKDVSFAYANSSQEEQNALMEQAKGLITEIVNDHVSAAKSFVQDVDLRETLTSKIEAECQELIEYIMAAKRFNLEINSRAKDRVISFGERLSCLYMTALLHSSVCLHVPFPEAFPLFNTPPF